MYPLAYQWDVINHSEVLSKKEAFYARVERFLNEIRQTYYACVCVKAFSRDPQFLEAQST
jgi:hypothetical protein